MISGEETGSRERAGAVPGLPDEDQVAVRRRPGGGGDDDADGGQPHPVPPAAEPEGARRIPQQGVAHQADPPERPQVSNDLEFCHDVML